MLDDQGVISIVLELDFHAELCISPVEFSEVRLDPLHLVCEIKDLVCRENRFAVDAAIGFADILDFVLVAVDFWIHRKERHEELFRDGVFGRVRHKIFTHLDIHIIPNPIGIDDVLGYGDAIGQFVLVVRVHDHTHGCVFMTDAIEFALLEGTVVPHAGPDLFDRILQRAFVRIVGVGVVEPGSIEAW